MILLKCVCISLFWHHVSNCQLSLVTRLLFSLKQSVQLVEPQLFTVKAIFLWVFPPCECTLQILQWCHVHTLCTKSSQGLNPTLWSGFEKYTMYRTHHHCSSKKEFVWESSPLHSVTVSVSIGVFLISPRGEPCVEIVDCWNCAQHTVVTMLTAMLTASGYLSTLAIFTLRHTTVLAARINWSKVVHSTVRWKTLPGARFTKHPKLFDLVLNYKPDGYYIAKFGSWPDAILGLKCSRALDLILLPFFTKDALSRQEPHWILSEQACSLLAVVNTRDAHSPAAEHRFKQAVFVSFLVLMDAAMTQNSLECACLLLWRYTVPSVDVSLTIFMGQSSDGAHCFLYEVCSCKDTFWGHCNGSVLSSTHVLALNQIITNIVWCSSLT